MLPLWARVDLGAMAMKGFLHIPQRSNITGTSPSDCLVSYPGYSWGCSGSILQPQLQRCSGSILQPQPTGQGPDMSSESDFTVASQVLNRLPDEEGLVKLAFDHFSTWVPIAEFIDLTDAVIDSFNLSKYKIQTLGIKNFPLIICLKKRYSLMKLIG